MNDNYKKTKLGWIPKDWEVVKLGNVARCSVGIASSATHAYRETGIPLIRNQNIKEGKLDLSDVLFVSEEYELLHKTKRLKEGDILTVRTGYPGVSAVVPKELENAQSFTTLIIRRNTNNLTSEFLCYFINSDFGKNFFNTNQAGGGQQNVGSKTLEKLNLPVPPLPEQKKIAQILSTIDAKINNLSHQITETETLKKGLMQQLLTEGIGHSEFKDSKLGRIPRSWEVVKLNKVADINKNTLSNSTNDNYEFYYIDLSSVKNGQIDFPNEQVSFKNAPSRARRLIKQDDLIMATVRPNLLGYAFVNFEASNYICSTGFAIITPIEEKFNGQFLYQLLYSSNIQNQIDKLIVGSNYPAINSKDVSGLKIPLPPLPEQKEIAKILSTVDAKLDVLRASRKEYGILKKGMMQVLLTGEVRV